MDNKIVLTKLEKMKGKTFHYGNNIHCFLDFKMDDTKEKCIIKTNIDSFERSFDSIEEFLKYWKPAPNLATLQTGLDINNHVDIFVEQENSLSNNLIAILNDNIEKVQKNKEYIPQAQAINKNINSIVNIAKMRLDLMKQLNRL